MTHKYRAKSFVPRYLYLLVPRVFALNFCRETQKYVLALTFKLWDCFVHGHSTPPVHVQRHTSFHFLISSIFATSLNVAGSESIPGCVGAWLFTCPQQALVSPGPYRAGAGESYSTTSESYIFIVDCLCITHPHRTWEILWIMYMLYARFVDCACACINCPT